jgi:hypothetical protein
MPLWSAGALSHCTVWWLVRGLNPRTTPLNSFPMGGQYTHHQGHCEQPLDRRVMVETHTLGIPEITRPCDGLECPCDGLEYSCDYSTTNRVICVGMRIHREGTRCGQGLVGFAFDSVCELSTPPLP